MYIFQDFKSFAIKRYARRSGNVTFLRIQFPPHTVVSTISKTMCWMMGSELPQTGSGQYEIYLDRMTIYLFIYYGKDFEFAKFGPKHLHFTNNCVFAFKYIKFKSTLQS